MVIAEGKWRLKVKEKIQAKPRLDFSVLKQVDTARNFLESMTTHYHFDADSSVDTNFGSMVDAFNTACQETDLPVQTREQKRIPWEDRTIVALREERQLAKSQYLQKKQI
jgi:hypothetical protein